MTVYKPATKRRNKCSKEDRALEIATNGRIYRNKSLGGILLDLQTGIY